MDWFDRYQAARRRSERAARLSGWFRDMAGLPGLADLMTKCARVFQAQADDVMAAIDFPPGSAH